MAIALIRSAVIVTFLSAAANFSRIDRPKDEALELSAWSPTLVKSFHVPGLFGKLRFDEEEHP